MKFLATGDLQIHAWRQFSYTLKNGMNSRLYNCLKVFDFLLEEAKKRGIKRILINGDTFEENSYIDVEVFDATYLRLEKLHSVGMEVVINIGNHDISRQSGRRILHSLRAFRKVATVVEEPTHIWGDSVFVVPWDSSPDRIKEAIRSCKASKNKILVLHCGVQGATTGPTSYLVRNPIKLDDVRHTEFGLVVLSDYHTRQFLAPNVLYMGSPLQHSFGEIHSPCVWRFSAGGRGIHPRMEKIPTSFPRFRRVSVSSEHELSHRTRNFKGDYVQVTAGDSLDERRIERIASRIGFQYTIKREAEEVEDSKQSKSFDISKVMEKYVESQVGSVSKQQRLLRLGEKLYEGS